MTLVASFNNIPSITITKELQTLMTFYFLWIMAHHVSANLYTYFCTSNTLFGIISSPFLASAPHCVAMRWVIYEGGNMINVMWVSFGSYIGSKILMWK
jgi:hypothetical protein